MGAPSYIDLGDETEGLGPIDGYYQDNKLPGFCMDLPFAAPGHPDAACLLVTRLRRVKTQADSMFVRDARQRWMCYFGACVDELPALKDVPLVAVYDPARGLFAPLLTWMMYEDPPSQSRLVRPSCLRRQCRAVCTVRFLCFVAVVWFSHSVRARNAFYSGTLEIRLMRALQPDVIVSANCCSR